MNESHQLRLLTDPPKKYTWVVSSVSSRFTRTPNSFVRWWTIFNGWVSAVSGNSTCLPVYPATLRKQPSSRYHNQEQQYRCRWQIPDYLTTSIQTPLVNSLFTTTYNLVAVLTLMTNFLPSRSNLCHHCPMFFYFLSIRHLLPFSFTYVNHPMVSNAPPPLPPDCRGPPRIPTISLLLKLLVICVATATEHSMALLRPGAPHSFYIF